MSESRSIDPGGTESAITPARDKSHETPLTVDPELAGLMRSRRLEARRHQAQLAQIRRHPDPGEEASDLAQQRIWALRHARQLRLKRSDLAMLRRSS